ncbi:hypothetical protein V1974_32565, partial [Pseudomonas aeruginosa]
RKIDTTRFFKTDSHSHPSTPIRILRQPFARPDTDSHPSGSHSHAPTPIRIPPTAIRTPPTPIRIPPTVIRTTPTVRFAGALLPLTEN